MSSERVHRAVYLIDTCVWVNFKERHSLGEVLVQLRPHAAAGCIKAIGKVLDELKRRWKDVHKEVKKLPIRVHSSAEMEPRVVTLAGSLLRAHPFLGQALSPYDTADPWVIAAAEIHGWKVVTDEGSGRRPNKSIRGVCKSRGVDCLDRQEFARELRIVL